MSEKDCIFCTGEGLHILYGSRWGDGVGGRARRGGVMVFKVNNSPKPEQEVFHLPRT